MKAATETPLQVWIAERNVDSRAALMLAWVRYQQRQREQEEEVSGRDDARRYIRRRRRA